ncbi:MAG: glycosyltransferase family 39 protein [Myxococcota bacterium]
MLFAGLGSTGLWEPWEMDRADLARTLAAPPEAVVALGAGQDATTELVTRAAAQAGVVIRKPDPASGNESQTTLGAAMALAQARTVATVVIDLDLILAGGLADTAAWPNAAQKVSDALDATAGGTVVLVSRGGVSETELRHRLALERWRAAWQMASATWGLDGLATPDQVQAALGQLATTDPGDANVRVVGPTDLEGLRVAFEDGASAIDGRVAFKDRGDTVATPPLESWLRAAAYKILGPSELSTRLPGVVLALVALWVLLATLRTVYGARIAFMAGIVLATLPLFYAQARVAQGDPGMMLALTLFACGQLLATDKDVPRTLPWSYFVTGLVVGVLAKGLFAPALFGVLGLSAPLIMGSRTLRDWLPGIVAAAFTGIVYLLVRGADPQTFLSSLSLKVPLFESGTTLQTRDFDLVIQQLGFGLNPWSPLVVAAVGSLAWWAVEAKDPKGLLVALWFFVPAVAVMAAFKDANHYLFSGAPAAAAAVAIFGERVLKRGVPAYFLATVLVLMYVILRHDLKEQPQSMVGWLTWEQPFSKEGANRFPETLQVGSGIRWILLLAGVFCLAHFGRVASALTRFLAWVRRDEPPAPAPSTDPTARGGAAAATGPRLGKPIIVTVAVCLVLAAVVALFLIGRKHGPYMSSRYADSIGPSEKAFVADITSFTEPIFMVSIFSIVTLLVTAVLRFGFSFNMSPPPLIRRWGLPIGAAIWAAVGIILAISTRYPDDFWGEALVGLPSLIGYIGALALAVLVWWLGKDRLHTIAAAVGALAFLFVQRLVRDADWHVAWVGLGMFVGFVGVALTVVPSMLTSSRRFAIVSAVLSLVFAAGFIVPLAERWAWLRYLPAEPGSAVTVEPLAGEILDALVPSIVLVALAGLLVAYRYITRLPRVGQRFVDGVDAVARWFERPHVFAGLMALLGAAMTAITLFSFGPSFAINVSQKHIIDAWREAEAGPDNDKRIFKLPMGGVGHSDSNFYTASVPEIRDRTTALQVLLGTQDQVVTLETELGTEQRVLTGWSPANDRNQDMKRDEPAIRGYASAVSPDKLTDQSKTWTPGSLRGKRLVNATGQTWNIIDNDQTSVTVEAGARLAFAPAPLGRAYYVIDGQSPDPHASAEAPERRALLVPADSLSEINFQWRKLSGGRHLPILDGSSYRVLLATSWLQGDETQHNRLALATFDDKSFAAIEDGRLKRVWGNFDDTIQVVGYQLESSTVSSGQSLKLTVYYKALKTIQKSWKIFIHLDRVGAGGTRIGGDHWPLNPTKHSEENKNCTGCYRTDHWLPGDIVQDTYDIEIPETSSGEYMIYVGFFDPGPDKRLAIKDWDRKNVRHLGGDNRLGIGTFQIR